MNQQRQALIKDLYESIENRSIIRGQQLLTERELCDIFHVKRSLLREALVALEALGVIDIRERQGMFLMNRPTKMLSDSLDFLSDFSPSLLHDKSIEARMIIEPKAAGMAAENCTQTHDLILRSEIAFLEDLYSTGTAGAQSQATLAYKHNIIIHNTIVEMANNIVLTNIYKYLSDLSRNVFAVLGQDPAGFQPYALWPDVLIGEHRAIVQAIVTHDKEGAEQAMYEHLQNSQRRNSTIMAQKLHGTHAVQVAGDLQQVDASPI